MEPTHNNSTPATDDRPMFGETARLPFPNPFVGLRPFRTEESLLFFGRNEQTIELLQQLHRTRFLAVVGSSGCGKSSLIRAGLIPKLKAGFLVEDRDVWLTVTMKPGTDPIGNLAESLVNEISAQQNGGAESLAKQIRTGGTQAILEFLKPALADSDANLLLLADQFEEVFSAGDEAADFISILLALAEQKALPIYVVLTMRSDFWDRCEEFYGLPEAMNRSLYMVPRLTRQQRQQAIEGPIRLFGANLTARLLDRVLNDAGDQSDQLPVMQHVLMRTWDEWRKPSKEHQAKHSGEASDVCCYEAVGTIKEALSRDAEAALAGMTPEELIITQRMFQALTDTDANNRRVRRRVHLNEIAAIAEAAPDKVRTVIKRFNDDDRSFLVARPRLTANNPQIDLSHESLIRQWDTLGDWIDQESVSRDIYLRVVMAATRRKLTGANLWSGFDLDEALIWREVLPRNKAWANRYDPNFDQAMSFLDESQKAEEESQRQKEAAAKETEERRKSELRRTRRFAGFVTSLLIATALLAWAAWRQQQETEKQRRIAVSQKELSDAFYFDASMNLAQNAFEKGNYSRGFELTNQFLDPPFDKARNFYWYYWWRENHQESNTLKGHESSVLSVAFTPDGKTLASASDDKTVRLWDTGSGQLLNTLKAHESSVLSVAFAPDGETLVSASADKIVKFWDVRSGQLLKMLKGHESSVRSVAFSPDGKALASAGDDKSVKLWDVRSGQLLNTLKGHEASVRSVAFAPDGKTLASASLDKTIRLWDVRDGHPLNTLKEPKSSVLSVVFAPDGKTLASALLDNTVKLWDARSGQLLNTLIGHKASVWSVTFTADGSNLASASLDKTINLWDVRSGQLLNTLKGHEGSVNSITFTSDGKWLASASIDKTVKLWDAPSISPLNTFTEKEFSVWSVAFAPDSQTLASASDDRTVKFWDVRSGQLLKMLKGHESSVRSVAFSPDGKALASAGDDKSVKLWDVRSGQLLNTLKGHEAPVMSVAFASDGNTLASASDDRSVKLWNVHSGQLLNTLRGHESSVKSVAFALDGKLLASASADDTIKLWDARSGQLLNTLKGHESAIWSVAFAPDGKTLASASFDKTVKLWDTRSGQLLNTLKGHNSSVNSVAFTPDGKTLASASFDKTIKLWDARSGQFLNTLKAHEHFVMSVAFASDGKMLASAEGDPFASGAKDFIIRMWVAGNDGDVARQRNK